MLRPEQMSKVSVAGSKRVLESVIETVHGMQLLHLSDYDESWDSFELGRSLEGAEEVNEKLVTVRSLESILEVSPEDADETIVIDEAELETELASLRETVNDLDDQRSELRTQRREIDEEIEAVEPFADLGIELDLLSGYDSLVVSVGEGNREAIESTLAANDSIDTFEIMSGDRTHAIFAKPTTDVSDEIIADALVGVEFSTVLIPDAEGSPAEYVDKLETQKAEIESELDELQAELDSIKTEQASFLLSAEEYLTIEAQKKQAPLSFATTENAFVAEGWIPTDEYDEFESALVSDVDGPVDVDEIKRASFKSNGEHHIEDSHPETPTVEDDGSAVEEPAAADGGEKARADGGVVTTDDEPPVVQDNPRGARTFEVIVDAVAKPNYKEFDPTILVFLTFPLMFGFMIGDVGYGLIYMAIGGYLYTQYDSSGLKSMGGVALWSGLFTTIFGFFYDEIFGLHVLSEPLPYYLGLPTLHKGLQPQYAEWALAWFVVSVLVGIVHVDIGYILSFIEDNEFHGFKEALYESGSWLFMLNGLWMFVFSRSYMGSKPEFIYTAFSAEGVIPLGFTGLPEVFGTIGLVGFGIGVVLLGLGSLPELAEALSVLVNVLSYTRIAAVLLAKAGMAYAVNLIVFGAYVDHGERHYIFSGEYLAELQAEGVEIVFPGLVTGDALGLALAIPILIIGHAAVLTLGITSAGLQAVRLEYVEFFTKFYDGGGRDYSPFGYARQYTTTDD